MTSIIFQTGWSPLQQVCKYHPTHSGISYPNGVFNFFTELCNTSKSILMDNVLERTLHKKNPRAQIWAAWWSLASLLPKNSAKKDIVSFTTCHSALSCWKTVSHSSINCWIIPWYTSTLIVVSKKNWSPCTFTNFWGCNYVVWRMRGFSELQTIILRVHVVCILHTPCCRLQCVQSDRANLLVQHRRTSYPVNLFKSVSHLL